MWADALASALEHASEDSEAEVIPIGHSNGSLLLPWALRLNQMRGNRIRTPRVVSIAAQNPTIQLNGFLQRIYFYNNI